jgi:diguanylate cyclase (GGDEF)-like protein
MSPNLLASYIVQAAGALFTAVLFGFFARNYQKPFLRHWARAWASMCVMLAAGAIGASLVGVAPASSATRLTISMVAGVAAYFQIVWLVWGMAELVSADAAATFHKHRVAFFGSAAFLGILFVALYANDPNPMGTRYLLRVGVRTAFTGVAFLAAAVVVWRARPDLPGTGRSLGRTLVSGAFVLYGALQLHLSYASFFDLASISGPAYSLYSGFVDFFLLFAMGLGVVIWLLEDEHSRTRSSSDQIAQLAFHDPLTGLPNRKLFLDRLTLSISSARRENQQLAVYFIDLDRFKVINDSLGHSAGDKLLQVVAQRVREVVREADTVGRMGGDEFVVLTPTIGGVEDAVHIAQKIREAIRDPVTVEGRELFASGSMGVALYPTDGATAEELLKNADTAMYRAKAQGSDLLQLYTPEMNLHAVEQLALESALRHAVERLEFDLHYQPIVRTTDNRIATLEAMLRWRHPVMGMVRPEQFIRLAESSGLIVPIGDWALRTACKQLAVWRATHPEIRLAVNISGRQLKQPDFVDRVRAVLEEAAVPPTALEFEITEMSATQSEHAIVDRLRELRTMGVRISIDDFGTGFSSVSVLRTFPVDALKIDTSFVRDLVLDPNDAAIAAAVVALAKSMGLMVVAEGVENPAQLEFLRQQGCEMWQGYLCCPPVQTSEVLTVLGRRSGAQLQQRASIPVDVAAVKH